MFKLQPQCRYTTEEDIATRVEMSICDEYLADWGTEIVELWKSIFKTYLRAGYVLEWRDRLSFIDQWDEVNSCDLFPLDYQISIIK